MAIIKVQRGDITLFSGEAIVNAANSSLLGGGGVDGAIHSAAGPQLLKECRAIGGCPTGEARITSAYQLKASWIIHTVGPVWHGGKQNEEKLLKACYHNSLQLATNKGIRSIAFPNISTGVYGYPKSEAGRIALKAVQDFLTLESSLQEITFMIFDSANWDIYQEILPGGLMILE